MRQHGKELITIVYFALTCWLPGSTAAQDVSPPTIGGLSVGFEIQPNVRAMSLMDTVTVSMWLENNSSTPVEIRHGYRLMFIEAQRGAVSSAKLQRDRSNFADYNSWGEAGVVEFPNPNAPYPTNLVIHVLKPGERYHTTAYRMRFPSTGIYVLRFCADLGPVRLCNVDRGGGFAVK